MDDIWPYEHTGTNIVELPVHWILDDAPHLSFDLDTWSKRIASAAEVRTLWWEELSGIFGLGGLAVLTMHPQIIGRPGRLSLLDDVLGFVKDASDVHVGTGRDIAQWVRLPS